MVDFTHDLIESQRLVNLNLYLKFKILKNRVSKEKEVLSFNLS